MKPKHPKKRKLISRLFNSLLKVGLAAVILVFGFALACNLWVVRSQLSHNFTEEEQVPGNKVGLVLGTSRYVQTGRENLFFTSRIEAASKLYCANRIKHVIVSGDNSKTNYNEPREMFRALVAQGVDPEDITLDYAGFRTLDSVVRSKKVFQQDKITIISQGFHNYRALFIADYYDLEAIAFAADPKAPVGFRPVFREQLARVKAVLDLYILHTQPKFLGEEISLPI